MGMDMNIGTGIAMGMDMSMAKGVGTVIANVVLRVPFYFQLAKPSMIDSQTIQFISKCQPVKDLVFLSPILYPAPILRCHKHFTCSAEEISYHTPERLALYNRSAHRPAR